MNDNMKPEINNVTRLWGSFDQFARNAPCTVSLMYVEPGKHLSIQSHSMRDELWIVIDDNALVQLGENESVFHQNDRVWIPAGTKHCLTNPGAEPIRVLEVAFGTWEQEDIVRYTKQGDII